MEYKIIAEPYSKYVHLNRAAPASKYAALFAELPPNTRLALPIGDLSPEDLRRRNASIANALRKHAGNRAIVRIVHDCKDGFSGVWWWPIDHPDAPTPSGHHTSKKAAIPTHKWPDALAPKKGSKK
jgi:hypothetical protein